jgi:hypothetical protein
MKNQELIDTFITNNTLNFADGSRNTTVTILIGYALYLDMKRKELLETLDTQIKADSFIEQEVNRLWKYCKNKSYGKYWETTEAKNKYKF